MTDTTDIAALMRDMRDLADRIIDAEGENNNGEVGRIIDMYDAADTTFKAENILLVLNAFEAERQRAEQLSKSEWKMAGELSEAQAELTALKGEQVPVGKFVFEPSGERWHHIKHGEHQHAEPKLKLVKLFTQPQKPVVHPDTKRMDWLCAHVVEVRQPLFYGSHAMFYGQCDSDDCEEYHSKLREQVDAAIEAGGIVKDGE